MAGVKEISMGKGKLGRGGVRSRVQCQISMTIISYPDGNLGQSQPLP